jgi:hypothetical protein
MFGALNRFIGRLDSEGVQQNANGPGDNSFGFQILRNKDADLPLEPWFDFIIGINGHLIVRTLKPHPLAHHLLTGLVCRKNQTTTSL